VTSLLFRFIFKVNWLVATGAVVSPMGIRID